MRIEITIKRLRNLILMGIVMTCMPALQAQDVDFSQFFNNPTYFNPAYVGLTKGLKVRMNYRRQWTGLSGDYHAYDFSADIADRNIPGAGGIGIIATSDLQGLGLLKTSMVGIIPAVRIPINSFSVFQVGALISIISRQINWNNLVFSDQLDPRLGNIGPSSFPVPGSSPITFPDFTIGGIYQMQLNNLVGTFGFAVHHITQPNQSFLQDVAPLPREYVAHADVVIDLARHGGFYSRARDIKINPGIFYKQQSTMSLLTFGANAYISNIYFGIWYKDQIFSQKGFGNFVWLAGVNVPFSQYNRMKVMYSFDMNVLHNTNFTGPSHEISLIFELDNAQLINPNRLPAVERSEMECSPF
ncbi:MAG: PorP/SprF family type IX secretion system membrane protein [Bacteroidales bacterium]|nr:PorP/SprF family type IX secretion system membrane protein [Bacteroidales bacterium]